MRLLEFIHKVDEEAILEAAKDRYWQMFASIPPAVLDLAEANDGAALQAKVANTMAVYQRTDRITWALRLMKHMLMLRAREAAIQTLQGNVQISDDYRKGVEEVLQYVNKQEGRLAAKSGMSESELQNAAAALTGGQAERSMEHFLSLPIPAIQDYTFEWQTPSDIFNQFRELEKEWQEARKRQVSHTDDYEEGDIEPIIKFPDGSAWFDLKRQSCDVEAASMGHCGNRADAKDSHTVLSYRTPVKGTDQWIPHMTFILDKEHGTLGEMKGRGNEKPAAKYHPYIIDLLKQPYVKGFGPGGYEPQNNFSLDDLPEEQAAALKEMKPGFMTPLEHYKKTGMTEDLANRVISMVNEVSGEKTTYHPEDKEFTVDTYRNLEQAVEFIGGSTAEWVIGVMEGTQENYQDNWGVIDKDQMEELFDMLPDEYVTKIGEYTKREYGDEYIDEDGTSEYDFSNTGDLITMLDEQSDGVLDEFRRAISDGMDRGAENEMSDDFHKWLEDFSSDYIARIKHQWDEGAELRIGEESLLELIGNDDDGLWMIENEGWKDTLEARDLEQPNYGWSGYDEEAAKESFMDMFDESILE